MTLDPRLQNLISIEGGPRLVVGAPSGGLDAILNKSSATLAKAMTTLRQRAAEVRDHSQLLPSEKSRRLEELRHPAISAARAHQQTLQAEKARITRLSTTASPVRPLSQMPADAMWTGQLLCQRLMQMTVSEKTQIVAKCMSDPTANPLWTQVLLQWPIEVTGVDAGMYQQLRSAALQAMDPELAASIDIQLQQLELATRADELAQGILGEILPGAAQELREAPPEPQPAPAAAAATDHEVPDWLRADLESGGGLRRPSRVELLTAAAAAGARAAA